MGLKSLLRGGRGAGRGDNPHFTPGPFPGGGDRTYKADGMNRLYTTDTVGRITPDRPYIDSQRTAVNRMTANPKNAQEAVQMSKQRDRINSGLNSFHPDGGNRGPLPHMGLNPHTPGMWKEGTSEPMGTGARIKAYVKSMPGMKDK